MMTKKNNLDRSLGAGPQAYQGVYSKDNPTDTVVMIMAKGTGKSDTMDRYILQGIEQERGDADVMYIRDQENGHKTGAYANFEKDIELFDLKGYDMKGGASEHYVKKNGIEVHLGGFDRGEQKLTGFSKPLAGIAYDELLKASDADKSESYKKRRANQQLKAIGSLRRKLTPGGKIVLNANMHYKDPLGGEMIYKNFDVDNIRAVVKEKGFGVAILHGIEGFPNGITFLIADPDINQFLDSTKAKMPYVGEAESQAMTESLPDESLFKEFPLKGLSHLIHYYNGDDSVPGHVTEFVSMGADPASGKDELAVCFGGIDYRDSRMVLLDTIRQKTRGYTQKELINVIDKFGLKVNKKLLFYGALKKERSSFAMYFDTNQKVDSIRQMKLMIDKQGELPEDERIINLHPDHFMSLVNPASKSGEGDHTGTVNKLEEMIIHGKIGVIKKESNLDTIHDLINMRVKVVEDTEQGLRYKIISHSDPFDAFKYGLQIAYDTDYAGVIKLLGGQ